MVPNSPIGMDLVHILEWNRSLVKLNIHHFGMDLSYRPDSIVASVDSKYRLERMSVNKQRYIH